MIELLLFLTFIFFTIVLPVLTHDVSDALKPYQFSEYEANSLGEAAMFLNMSDTE